MFFPSQIITKLINIEDGKKFMNLKIKMKKKEIYAKKSINSHDFTNLKYLVTLLQLLL